MTRDLYNKIRRSYENAKSSGATGGFIPILWDNSLSKEEWAQLAGAGDPFATLGEALIVFRVEEQK